MPNPEKVILQSRNGNLFEILVSQVNFILGRLLLRYFKKRGQ